MAAGDPIDYTSYYTINNGALVIGLFSIMGCGCGERRKRHWRHANQTQEMRMANGDEWVSICGALC